MNLVTKALLLRQHARSKRHGIGGHLPAVVE